METYTAQEIAEAFRCSKQLITRTATRNWIGVNLKGPAGYRFTEADKAALWQAMRAPAPDVLLKRRRA